MTYFVKWHLDIKGELAQPPTKNARILTSRNQREGWYYGKNRIYSGCPRFHNRTWSKPVALRYRHIQFGKVSFKDLAIPLYTPTGEPNGTT